MSTPFFAEESINRRLPIKAGMVLGVGMGAFIDGIVFHQILQIHNMLSARIPPVSLVNAEINMVWDGLFHLLAFATTAIGIVMLWFAAKHAHHSWSGRSFIGSIIFGWGSFNFVEGVIDHHILNLHHVVERLGVSVYDYAFIAAGVLFTCIGWRMMRAPRLA